MVFCYMYQFPNANSPVTGFSNLLTFLPALGSSLEHVCPRNRTGKKQSRLCFVCIQCVFSSYLLNVWNKVVLECSLLQSFLPPTFHLDYSVDPSSLFLSSSKNSSVELTSVIISRIPFSSFLSASYSVIGLSSSSNRLAND